MNTFPFRWICKKAGRERERKVFILLLLREPNFRKKVSFFLVLRKFGWEATSSASPRLFHSLTHSLTFSSLPEFSRGWTRGAFLLSSCSMCFFAFLFSFFLSFFLSFSHLSSFAFAGGKDPSFAWLKPTNLFFFSFLTSGSTFFLFFSFLVFSLFLVFLPAAQTRNPLPYMDRHFLFTCCASAGQQLMRIVVVLVGTKLNYLRHLWCS